MEAEPVQEVIKSIYAPHDERAFDEWDLSGYGEILWCVATNRSIELTTLATKTDIPNDRVEGIVGVMDILGLVEWSTGDTDSTVDPTAMTWSILLRSTDQIDTEEYLADIQSAAAAAHVLSAKAGPITKTPGANGEQADEETGPLSERQEELGSDRANIKNHDSNPQTVSDPISDVFYGDVALPPIGDVAYFELEIDTQLSEGGAGEVSLARTPDGHRVAIKTLKSSETVQAEAIDRLMTEAETWSKLDDHDHIVNVYEYNSTPIPYILMEYMDGGNLRDRRGEFSIDQAVTIATSISNAILHAHRHGIVHLDIKPKNVLFRTATHGLDVPRVSDWGQAERTLDPSNDGTGYSLRYAAPEQFDESCGRLDHRTDIYQLGALVYTLVSGKQPYTDPDATVPQSVLREDPPLPSREQDVPKEIDRIISTAMATDPDDRFEDVIYLRDRLVKLSD